MFKPMSMPCVSKIASLILLLALVPFAAVDAQSQSVSRASPVTIESEKQSFRVFTLVQGLENPWSMAFLPDGRVLVTERSGRMRLITKKFELDPIPISGLPEIESRGQGGLFDVVLHPDYEKNGWVYWAYNAPGAGGWGTALARGRLQDHRMTDVQVLFSMEPKTRSGQHFGGRIAFDQAGMLYLTLGDRGDKERAQAQNDHAGSVIRLHDDGRLPSDNPFIHLNSVKPEKWTLGNRNIQGISIHPQTQEVWTHEHGPQGGDEINVVRAGRNYGWPVITHGVNYGLGTKIGEGKIKDGMEQPVYVWVPSIAPSGMVFVKGQHFANWNGDLLIGALRDQSLIRLELKGNRIVHEERLLKGQVGRIRDVRMGPDGLIYLLTDSTDGALLRLEPSSL